MPTTNPFTLPPEYQAPIDLAEMRGKLAQAMMQRYTRPVQGQMVGKHYVKSNPLQHLANVLGQHWQQQGMEGAVKDAGEFRAKAGADLQSERQNIVQALASREEPSLGADTGESPSGPRIVPGNPQEAERLALAAKFPGNRDLAKVLMEHRMKLLDAGAKGATNPSVVAAAQAGGDVSQLRGAYGGNIEETEIGGRPAAVTYDPKSNEPKVQFAPRDIKVSASATAGGKIEEKGVDYRLDQLKKSTEAADNAVGSLRSVQESLAALDQGAKTGITQPIQQIVRKLMEDVGVKAGPEANDLLASRLKDMVIKRAGGLGRQISDKDREFLEAASGAMMTDPVALRRILAISAAQDMLTVDRHNQSVQDMRAKYPDMEAALASDYRHWQFRPGQKTDPMVEAVLTGRSTFDVLPAEPTIGPADLKPGLGGRPLTPAEEARKQELRKKLGLDK